jgi:glutamine amidotransferase
MTIAIVDYRAGNLTSVKKAVDRVSQGAVVTCDPSVVARAEKIILPGVGHFSATATLCETGLAGAIQQAIGRGVSFLGICVGMQWMIESSEEASDVHGLGIWPGLCERFPAAVKAPHVGWNQLEIANGVPPGRSSRLLQGVPSGSFVYFTHSYRVPLLSATVAECEYGGRFSAAVEQDNLFGVQFHPEKSGAVGLQILENFCRL